MSSKYFVKCQLRIRLGEDLERLTLEPRIPTLNGLPEPLPATILSHALSRRRDGFLTSIMTTAKMNTKTTSARPCPNFLLVNKKFHRVGKQVWLTTDFCHIYVNSWTPLHRGLISSARDFPFLVMTIDIRRGERSLGEKLIPSAFGAKLRESLQEMKSLEVLLIRVWHGLGSLGPVSEIIMNNFTGVKVGQAVNIASIVNTSHCIDGDRGCPGLLSESYMENFVSHFLHLPLKDIPKPTTAYLDDTEPLLKIPIWRGYSAALETVDSVWLPAVKEPGEEQDEVAIKNKDEKEENEEGAEKDETMAESFRDSMMNIPWVKAAARAAKRQQKAGKKKQKKEKKNKKISVGEKEAEGS
ncbi:hypothetical protein M436DRAFT_86021 [Aureobasidium namibiae CBS 147.97]|uniref:Uncharacterized protein n=1 Tax=Aureobasidium namibiae CBS 147.97 TaxID=1043004 RepID=A0A074W6V3_9PEZI